MRSEGANLSAQRAKIRPETADLRLQWPGGGTEGRPDGHLEIPPCVLQDIGPLGSLPKKAGYKDTQVACGWAMINRLDQALGQAHWC